MGCGALGYGKSQGKRRHGAGPQRTASSRGVRGEESIGTVPDGYLKPKLIPFAKGCLTSRPRTVIQEDKAPAHNHSIQQLIYDREGVERLLWCGNSPDLNAIECAWPWLKRRTTRHGAPKARQEAIRAWHQAWEEMPQELIQAWIERIPRHVQEIIKLEGGNEYKEGRG